MDRIGRYRELIKQALCEIAAEIPKEESIRTELVFDEEHEHYELLEVGWDGPRRIHGCLAHCDVIGDKIWVQPDGTAFGIADFLLANGVPQEDIVLGFHPPELRARTPFAVA
ncbi:MAG TPA: XisI protein [Chthonomonadaceae bacterium]|nr:XisI protein [Chthonomonadaceae bacterium]